jgi:hypothetical protein
LFRRGPTYRNRGNTYEKGLLEEIIFNFTLMSKTLDPRGQLWPIGRIDKTKLVEALEDEPLDKLEVFCNIFREVVKQETTKWRKLSSGHSLVHHGSVFNYFYNPRDIMDPTDRLVYLFDVTLDVIVNNENILHCHSVLEKFDEEMMSFHCAFDSVHIGADHILGYEKLQSLIRQRNKNGDHILHESAKRGNYKDILYSFYIYSTTRWNKFYPILTPSHLERTTLDILKDTYYFSCHQAWNFYRPPLFYQIVIE